MGFGLVVVALVVLGVPVWWMAQTYRPAAIAPSEAERMACLRHNTARGEIQAIEAATVSLMRAVAATSGGESLPSTALEARPDARISRVRQAAGITWSPDPAASSTSPVGGVTFYTGDTQRS